MGDLRSALLPMDPHHFVVDYHAEALRVFGMFAKVCKLLRIFAAIILYNFTREHRNVSETKRHRKAPERSLTCTAL